VPSPIPSAFAQTNIFTFGSAPQSNFAKPSDPVQMFYAMLSPTVVLNGTSVHIAAITTTNASTVKVAIGSTTITLGRTGPGQWQATFPFPAGAIATGQRRHVIVHRGPGDPGSVTFYRALRRSQRSRVGAQVRKPGR
jgi:hypothetical protein